MIPEFEEITEPLSRYELEKLLPACTRILNTCEGKSQAIKNWQIAERIQRMTDISLTGARVRKLINHIRNNGLIIGLAASAKGYYITKDPDEIAQYIRSLEHRNKAVSRVITRMKNYHRELTQPSLPL